VFAALRPRLEKELRLPAGQPGEGSEGLVRTALELVQAIGKDCAARLKEPFRSADHADLLYDEHGLPR
jgi:antitoxin VapB